MEWRQERVVVETERYRVEGKLTLPREGYRSRLSDHLNRRDQEFFTLFDELAAHLATAAKQLRELLDRPSRLQE